MAIKGVDTKCYILALFVRDDGERFLLGSGHYEFKDTQMHFAANAIQNDIVEVQGNDGFLLAGQVRRPGTQSFDGYVGDGTMSKEETESYRRQFFSFFRKNFFYKVIYVFSDGTAIQRKSGFLVDDPTVEELYQMYPEYHVALNFEDVNYYSYSEDEEGQEQYAKEATIDTSSMRATGGLVWDNLGVVWEDTQWGGEQTASGTEMTIQNEMNVPSIVDDIRLDGDTYQQTYSGKNLIDPTNLSFVYSSSPTQIELSSISNGIRMVNNGGASQDRFAVFRSVDLTPYIGKVVRMKATFGASGGIRLYRIASDGSNRSQMATTTVSDTEISFTVPTDLGVSPYLGYVLDVRAGGGTTVDFTDLIMTVDAELEPFEPYVGGIPAPNPSYPQSIQTVTGEQTITVRKKNLFDLNEIGGRVNNATKTVEGDTVKVEATGSSNAYATILIPNSDALLGKTCTLSFGDVSTNYSSSYSPRMAVHETKTTAGYHANATIVGVHVVSTGYNVTFTFPDSYTSDNNGFVIVLYTSNAGSSAQPGWYAEFSDIQLEVGEEPTAYQPFAAPQSYTIDLGSIELCKIGDYRDKIFNNDPNEDWYDPNLEDNAWYVHKECGLRTFSSSSGWTYGGKRNEYYGFYTSMREMNIGVDEPGLSNYFLQSKYASEPAQTCFMINSTGTVNNLIIYSTTITTTTEMNTLFGNEPMRFYYPLITPTDTKITDDTLIGQLDALGAMRLFIGENNLIVQATGTNIPAPLSFKYYTTVSMTGAEWEEGGSGGATVVEVDSITNTYPIWRVKGPAVDPQLSVINTNTTIRYTGTVTSTQTLEIDMFNKTAKLNGVSVIGNVSGDWVSLAPGTNRVIYTAENADAQPSTIEWQEVVG